MIPKVVFMAVQCLWPEVMLDQFRFLGNCLPTPPLTHVSALKSHVREKHWLGVGWMGSFENVFLVFLFLFNILNLVLLFYWKFSGPFSLPFERGKILNAKKLQQQAILPITKAVASHADVLRGSSRVPREGTRDEPLRTSAFKQF